MQIFAVGTAEDIIHGNAVKIRQNQQMLHGDGLIATLVSGIHRLAGVQQLRHTGLIHVHILTQVPQSVKIHKNAPPDLVNPTIVILEPFGTIDFTTFLWYYVGVSTYKC